MRLLAELFEVIEAETPHGGRAVSYEPRGYAWLKAGARRRRERSGPAGARTAETMTVETRSDPRVSVGRMLRFGGDDWRITTTQSVGGRGILNLERMR